MALGGSKGSGAVREDGSVGVGLIVLEEDLSDGFDGAVGAGG